MWRVWQNYNWAWKGNLHRVEQPIPSVRSFTIRNIFDFGPFVLIIRRSDCVEIGLFEEPQRVVWYYRGGNLQRIIIIQLVHQLENTPTCIDDSIDDEDFFTLYKRQVIITYFIVIKWN